MKITRLSSRKKNVLKKKFVVGLFIYISNPTLIITLTALCTFLKSFDFFPVTLLNSFVLAVGVGLGVFFWFLSLILIINKFEGPKASDEETTQFLITNIDYDSYVGQVAIGRLGNGTIELNKKYSDLWPNITKKRAADVPEDQNKWRNVMNKLKHFSEKPAKGD